jgi:hypothetical protein
VSFPAIETLVPGVEIHDQRRPSVKNRRGKGDIDHVAANATPGVGADELRDTDLGRLSWRRPALVGAVGSILLAVASNLPGSTYGPEAGGLWPLAVSGPAPSWEGPTVPAWAKLSDQADALHSGHLLPTLLVVPGVVLLGLAWVLLWRATRRRSGLGLRRL